MKMEKLPEVENAKALMSEATTWSVMKWLREKKKVRKTADHANAALDQLRKTIQQRLPQALRLAYEDLAAQSIERATATKPVKGPPRDPEVTLTAKRIKQYDDEAYRARADAEDCFDQAERKLSTSLAREGCRKAIHSWELHEKAIQKAEGFASPR